MKANDDIEEIFKQFLIQHNKNKNSFLIGFYKKVPRLNKIQLIIDKAHIMEKVSFNDVLLLIWFFRQWISTDRICTENVKNMWSNYMSAKLIKTQEKQRVVKHILTSRLFQEYQTDTVELDKSLFEEGNFNYILTVIDHFSKYAWVYPLVR